MLLLCLSIIRMSPKRSSQIKPNSSFDIKPLQTFLGIAQVEDLLMSVVTSVSLLIGCISLLICLCIFDEQEHMQIVTSAIVNQANLFIICVICGYF